MFGGKNQKSSENQSLIGKGAELSGNLKFEGDCYIDGLIVGDVSTGSAAKGYLSISDVGCVKGNVSVKVLDLSGTIEGDVYVSEKAVFGPSARVIGNVHYNLMEIASGAEINGQMIHEEGATAPDSSDEGDKSYIQGVASETAG